MHGGIAWRTVQIAEHFKTNGGKIMTSLLLSTILLILAVVILVARNIYNNFNKVSVNFKWGVEQVINSSTSLAESSQVLSSGPSKQTVTIKETSSSR